MASNQLWTTRTKLINGLPVVMKILKIFITVKWKKMANFVLKNLGSKKKNLIGSNNENQGASGKESL